MKVILQGLEKNAERSRLEITKLSEEAIRIICSRKPTFCMDRLTSNMKEKKMNSDIMIVFLRLFKKSWLSTKR